MSDERQPAVSSSNQAHYSVAFSAAVTRVLADEGELADDPSDQGGLTKFGISQRQYPEVNIAALTRDQAIAIYYRDWWQRFGYGELPAAVGTKLFDLAINMGADEAGRCLQRALKACGVEATEDGVVGPETRKRASEVNAVALLAALRSEAAGHYRLIAATRRADRVEGSSRFLKGWLRRAYE